MDRLFLYYRGNRKDEIQAEFLSSIDSESIRMIDDKTLTVNYFKGEFNTAKHFQKRDFSILMNGIYVHREKGISCCIDDNTFEKLWKGRQVPENIPSLFVNGAFCGLVVTSSKTYFFNDFMGFCPLYYYHDKGEIFVSTSFSLLVKMVSTTVNKTALNEFQLTGYNFSGVTAAAEINCLGPASMLYFGKNYRIYINNYDSFSQKTEVRKPQQEIEDEIAFQFSKAIERLYDSRIKYSMSMTGGIDSRLIYLLWQDKQNLMTETAGDGSSDFLKARQIIERMGNPELHSLENLFTDKYAEGIENYYRNCDNPLKSMGEFNSFHLDWKTARGSFLHMTGVGGELLDGENLYLSRDKWSVIKEGLTSYTYHELKQKNKTILLGNVLGIGNKLENIQKLDKIHNDWFELNGVVAKLDNFLGKTKFSECYTERFRTYRLANAGYYLSGSQNLAKYLTLMPFNDTGLMKSVCSYHPSSRELRKLTIALLKRHDELKDIPVDTTHLKIDAPYQLHRFFRVLRMVLNMGYHKKIPLLQKGEPPKFRAFPYFDPTQKEFRELVNSRLLNCSWFDQSEVKKYISEISKIKGFNFYLHHGAEANILIMLRLTYMEEKLNGSKY